MEQTSNTHNVSADDFFEKITMPREKMELPSLENEQDEQLTENDEENNSFLNYSNEHKETALFFIGLLDSGIGFLGMMLSGQNPERYQKFTKSAPPDYFVDATAAMVNKYQAKMSLESMFFSALVMIYAPVIPKALEDRKKALEEKEREARAIAEQERITMIQAISNSVKNG